MRQIDADANLRSQATEPPESEAACGAGPAPAAGPLCRNGRVRLTPHCRTAVESAPQQPAARWTGAQSLMRVYCSLPAAAAAPAADARGNTLAARLRAVTVRSGDMEPLAAVPLLVPLPLLAVAVAVAVTELPKVGLPGMRGPVAALDGDCSRFRCDTAVTAAAAAACAAAAAAAMAEAGLEAIRMPGGAGGGATGAGSRESA